MKLSILITTCIIALFSNSIFAESDIDYTKARIDVASKPGFNPYKDMADELKMFNLAQKLLDSGDSKVYLDAIMIQMNMPKSYPLSIFSYEVAGNGSNWLASTSLVSEKDKAALKIQSQEYFAIADLLHKSITNNSDCASIEDDCKVISIQEENVIMKRLWYSKISQELILDTNKKIAFDKIVAKNKKGELRTFYFNIWLLTPGNPNTVPLTHHSSGTPNGAPCILPTTQK